MRRIGLAMFWVALLAGCAPDIPSGTYVCVVNSDCPPDQTCGPGGVCERDATCVPRTCEELRAFCGQVDDGCGTTLQCGECSGSDTCGGGGIPNICDCEPRDCADVECGTIASGCGTDIDCGGCGPGETCESNECVCPPADCEGLCGTVLDQCGRSVTCDPCPSDTECGAGGPNVCGEGSCTPITCAEAGAECGEISNGCGEVIDCGDDCVLPDVCNGGLVLNQCDCIPSTTCGADGEECGTIDDGCGGVLVCGTCAPGLACRSNECVCDTVCEPDACDGTLGCGGCGVCGISGSCESERCVCDDDFYDAGTGGNNTPEAVMGGPTFPVSGRVALGGLVVSDASDDDWYHWRTPPGDGFGFSGTLVFTALLPEIFRGEDYDLEVIVDCALVSSDVAVECAGGALFTTPLGLGCRSSEPGNAREEIRLTYIGSPACEPRGLFVHVVPVNVAPRCHPYSLEIDLTISTTPAGTG
ncbi:MAG: hypothetical protein AB8I08_01495 [Sandaracinaceae bacterium]